MPEERNRRTHAPSSVRALLKRAQRRARRQERDADGPPIEAAEPTRQAEPDRPGPRPSLLADFLRPSRSQAIVAAVLFITALLISMGVKARTTETDFASMRRADLIQMLDTLNSDARKLEAEINELERTKQSLLTGADAAKVAQEETQRRLDAMRILAGTAPASGPGIRIVIADPFSKVGPELVLDAIEEMRDAGAEVMAINGTIRVVANTWFGRSSSGGLVVSGEPVSFPLVIEAIGDPATLEAGARFRGGLVSEIQNERVNGSVTISQLDQLRISAVIKPDAPRFSRPA
ncbi:MAG: DUF881 domain-containing protein [Propionibacteriaceae bacterium]|nr:DUF881 domain-containing protein [Propionibacteriaceae bacterium]